MAFDIKDTEEKLEQGVKAFHQYIYDKLGDALDMDDKLSLLCALAMAGMTDDGGALLEANDGVQDNGNIVASCVSCFLRSRQCPEQIASAAVQWSCAALERPALKKEGLVRDFFCSG